MGELTNNGSIHEIELEMPKLSRAFAIHYPILYTQCKFVSILHTSIIQKQIAKLPQLEGKDFSRLENFLLKGA